MLSRTIYNGARRSSELNRVSGDRTASGRTGRKRTLTLKSSRSFRRSGTTSREYGLRKDQNTSTVPDIFRSAYCPSAPARSPRTSPRIMQSINFDKGAPRRRRVWILSCTRGAQRFSSDSSETEPPPLFASRSLLDPHPLIRWSCSLKILEIARPAVIVLHGLAEWLQGRGRGKRPPPRGLCRRPPPRTLP